MLKLDTVRRTSKQDSEWSNKTSRLYIFIGGRDHLGHDLVNYYYHLDYNPQLESSTFQKSSLLGIVSKTSSLLEDKLESREDNNLLFLYGYTFNYFPKVPGSQLNLK